MTMWDDLTVDLKAKWIAFFANNGIYKRSEVKDKYNLLLRINKSDADFVQRLKDPGRAYIQDWLNPDDIATHKMSWAEDDNGAVVYSNVLNKNGLLEDYSRPPYDIWAGYDNAVKNGDTVRMTPLQAEWFTENYKPFYPGFNEYKKGGSIYIDPKNKGKLTETIRRTGKSKYELAHSKNPLTRKRALFAINASHWKHLDGGYLDDIIWDNMGLWNHKHQHGGPTLDWMDYWYYNRPQQLVSNFDDYYRNNPIQYSPYYQKIQDAYSIVGDGLGYVDNTPISYGPLDYDNNGYTGYDRNGNPYISMRIGSDNDAVLHEQTHVLNDYLGGSPFLNAIGDVTTMDLYKGYNHNEYLDNQDEIYSRLMQIRYRNNLDPKHKYTLDEIKRMRKENKLTLPKSDGLERYSDKFIQHLLNDVTYNDTNRSSNKAQTGGLILDLNGYYNHDRREGDIGIFGDSNGTDITMRGIDFPIRGISNKGEVIDMMPNMNYHFRGSFVREHPLLFGGLFKKKEQPNYLYATYGINNSINAPQRNYFGIFKPYNNFNPIRPLYIGRNYSMPDYGATAITSYPIYMNEQPKPILSNTLNIVDFLWAMENGNNYGMNKDGTYSRYLDPNGKDYDVGPGLVIGKAIEDKPFYTKEELDKAAYSYYLDSMNKLLPLYDDKYGAGLFDKLDDNSKMVIFDVMYRVGQNGVTPDKWPNLFNAAYNNDTQKLLIESRSKFKKNGKQNYDNARVKRVGEYLYPEMFEYQYNNSLDPNLKVVKKQYGGHLHQSDNSYIRRWNDARRDYFESLPIVNEQAGIGRLDLPEVTVTAPDPNIWWTPELSTYVDNTKGEPGLLKDKYTFAAEFLPYLGIASYPLVSNALKSQVGKEITKQLIASEIGGRSVDLASNAVTGKTFGLNVGNVVEGVTGWNPRNTVLGTLATEFMNPGYGLSGKALAAKNVDLVMPVTKKVDKAARNSDILNDIASIARNRGYATILDNTIRWHDLLHPVIGLRRLRNLLSSLQLNTQQGDGIRVGSIRSVRPGEGRKLYDAGIKYAQLNGFDGIISGSNLKSAPKTVSTWEHYYPTRKLVGNSGVWDNSNIVDTFKFRGDDARVNSVEEMMRRNGLDLYAWMKHAPEYLLDKPSLDVVLFDRDDNSWRMIWNEGKPFVRSIPFDRSNYYRVVGEDAIKDAKKTGVIRGSSTYPEGPYFRRGGTYWNPKGLYVIEGNPSDVEFIEATPYRYLDEDIIKGIDAGTIDPKQYYMRLDDDVAGIKKIADDDFGIEALPWYYQSTNKTPSYLFTYWKYHNPIIGWRQHLFQYGGLLKPFSYTDIPVVRYGFGGYSYI